MKFSLKRRKQTSNLNVTMMYIRPKRPELESFESRLSTFWNWPVNFLTKEEIAQAGFYYTGDSDCTRCYYCGGAVRNWRPEDDIWLEHVRWFPCCPLMEDTFSKQLIDIVCDMHKNREKITRSTVNREVQRLGLQLDKDKSNQEEDMDTSKD